MDEQVWDHVGPSTRHRAGHRACGTPPRRGRPASGETAGPSQRAAPGPPTATLDPSHSFSKNIRDELTVAITVLDAFHVVKFGGQVVDEGRRRAQRCNLDHRGRDGDRLFDIRLTLQIGDEHHNTELEAGNPHHEVTLAWDYYRKLRAVYHSRPARGRRLLADPGQLPHRPRVERPRRGDQWLD